MKGDAFLFLRNRKAFLLLLLALMALLQTAPVHELLWYDREAILRGEIWRLVTGHWLHLGWVHFAYNSLGLGLYWLLYGQRLSWGSLALVWLVTPLAVGLGLLVFAHTVTIYVGLSGVLHGAFLHAAIVRLRAGCWDGAYLLLLLVAKTVWEQYRGASLATAAMIGGAVVVDAHLFGVLAGAALGLAQWLLPAPSGAGSNDREDQKR